MRHNISSQFSNDGFFSLPDEGKETFFFLDLRAMIESSFIIDEHHTQCALCTTTDLQLAEIVSALRIKTGEPSSTNGKWKFLWGVLL